MLFSGGRLQLMSMAEVTFLPGPEINCMACGKTRWASSGHAVADEVVLCHAKFEASLAQRPEHTTYSMLP